MNKNRIQIAKKTLMLLTKKPWDKIDLKEIINNSNNKSKIIKTKKDLLTNINRYIDYLLKKNLSKIEITNTKDMLFETIMTRFDILQSYRISFIKLFDLIKLKPQKSIFLIPSFLESMQLIASIANLKIKGIKGSIQIKGIFIIYIATFFEWINDNTKSMEKTMTALDKNLELTSKIIN